MSFTAAYTELRRYDPDNDEIVQARRQPRILDLDRFNSVPDRVEEISESTFHKIKVLGEHDAYSEYPKQTWKVLKGFKSWKPADAFGLEWDPELDDLVEEIRDHHEDYRTGPLGYYYNIERVGMARGGVDGVWRKFFAEVSRHTDPFAFYQSPYEGAFPDVTHFDDGSEKVWLCKCVDGAVYVEEQTFERVGTEVLLDELEEDVRGDSGGEQ